MEHFITGPSCADIWSRCADYLKMRRNAPEKATSESAEEGTAAHQLSEEAIQCGVFDCHEYIGREFNGHTVDSDMAEYVNLYTYRVKQLIDMCATLGVEVDYCSEYRVDLSSVYPGFFGTRDFHVIAVHSNWATIIDLKYGRVAISADTRQIKCYALDIVLRFPHIQTVRAEIVQPRANHVDGCIRVLEYTRQELLDFIPVAANMQRMNHDTEWHGATAGDHCTYCEALGTCRTAMQYVLAVVEPAKLSVNVMNAEDVAKVLAQQKLVTNFFKAAYTWGLTLAKRGVPIDNFKMVKVPSRAAFEKGMSPDDAQRKIKLLSNKDIDLDVIAPRRMGAVSKVREIYGEHVARYLMEPTVETVELRQLSESGTAVQSELMLMLQQPINTLEKKQ